MRINTVPRAALARALASSELQCSEPQALRAVLRWAEHAPNNTQQPKPNVIWHTAHSSRRGGGRRSVSDAQLRHTQGDLLALVRTEHIPQDNDALQQAIRRGILAPPSLEASSADAWLGRPPHRPPRCFLPYLDELKALLEDQQVPEAELARVRRTRYLNRIPDTLYMVAAERSAPIDAPSLSLVPCALRAALLARHRELRAAPRAQTALALPLARPETVAAQLALRCAREMSLPDSCADLLLAENDEQDREGAWSECEEGQQREAASSRPREPCCRSSSAGLSSAGSLSSAEHQLINDCVGGKSWRRATVEPRPPAAAAVPDVALAPNANTHLLCPPQHSFSGMGVLQLDLGDGATHTPRPGSRALRAASQHARHRDHTQQVLAILQTVKKHTYRRIENPPCFVVGKGA
ncbi:BTB/POZ domain-containing protein 7-like [Plutella xylostella]|uniref:BTB/POZ domain-containing protein 7-like n=1 Tax=Plutella xylostella TaxID=51655 RepID=UPI0020330448|nr:BTB/POZ domain-containing protein 7-like [Plutella xylostella]